MRHVGALRSSAFGAVLSTLVFVCLMAADGGATSRPPPRLVMLVPYSTGQKLTQVDARTLRPVRGGWTRRVWKYPATALSPAGTRLAVTGSRATLVLDTASGRVVEAYRDGGGLGVDDLYWLGGEDPWARDALLVGVVFGCTSSGCEYTITTLGSEQDDGFTGNSDGPVAALKGGLVFVSGGLHVFGRKHWGITISLRKLPRSAPIGVVADVAHDRLFAVSGAGVVAKIEHATHKPAVSYHRVNLNRRAFEAAWAGAGKIALWGEDGLGTIDTHTWKTSAIAEGVDRAVTTRFGIGGWSTRPGDGLRVFGPDGTMRFQVLADEHISDARAVADYLYADTQGGSRYSVNLRTGEVTGPLDQTGWIPTPTLVAIP